MKKTVIVLSVLMLLLVMACNKSETPAPAAEAAAAAAPDAAKTEAIQKIRSLLRNNEFAPALKAIDEAVALFGMDDFYGIKAQALQLNNQGEEALTLIDEALNNQKGERPRLLGLRHDILVSQKRFDEALTVIKTQDSESEKKSPWTCLTMAEDHMNLNQPMEAIAALANAVDRGLISKSAITEAEGNVFKPLLDTPEFKALMTKMDGRIGLGAPAKAFTLMDIKNKKVSLDLLKGKVVLLDFWATWCPPCREEIPNLKAYYAELKDKGFEIVGISLDKDRAALDSYLTEQGMTWIITYSGKMWQDETVALYGVNSIPSTWLIDKQGILRHFDLRGEELKAAIVALLAE